jgi:hypothetical protein
MRLIGAKRPDRFVSKAGPTFLFPRSVYVALAALCLAGLAVLGWLAAWFGVPAWYIRLIGTQTTGTATVIASCGVDDYATQGDNAETFRYIFQFTDARGQVQRLTSHSVCNNLYNDGEQITIWYMPNDLNSFLTSAEAFWLYVLSPLWAIITAMVSYFFWRLIRPFVQLARQRFAASS